MDITPYALAQRYVGIKELSEQGKDHPLVQWWLSLCGFSMDAPDEVPWCSAFVNGIAWELRLPRSKSAAARSWLNVGVPILRGDVEVGDVVILSRGTNPTQGHVAFFGGWSDTDMVQLLGGNQDNGVCVESFQIMRMLGIRRLT